MYLSTVLDDFSRYIIAWKLDGSKNSGAWRLEVIHCLCG